MKRVQKKMTKTERQAARYVDKKEANARKQSVKDCGETPTDKNVGVKNRKIHIVGVGVKPIKEANSFIIYGDHEKLYYIIDPEMASKIEPYEYIDIKAKAVGTAVTISSDTGALQSIYQFQNLKNCSK